MCNSIIQIITSVQNEMSSGHLCQIVTVILRLKSAKVVPFDAT